MLKKTNTYNVYNKIITCIATIVLMGYSFGVKTGNGAIVFRLEPSADTGASTSEHPTSSSASKELGGFQVIGKKLDDIIGKKLDDMLKTAKDTATSAAEVAGAAAASAQEAAGTVYGAAVESGEAAIECLSSFIENAAKLPVDVAGAAVSYAKKQLSAEDEEAENPKILCAFSVIGEYGELAYSLKQKDLEKMLKDYEAMGIKQLEPFIDNEGISLEHANKIIEKINTLILEFIGEDVPLAVGVRNELTQIIFDHLLTILGAKYSYHILNVGSSPNGNQNQQLFRDEFDLDQDALRHINAGIELFKKNMILPDAKAKFKTLGLTITISEYKFYTILYNCELSERLSALPTCAQAMIEVAGTPCEEASWAIAELEESPQDQASRRSSNSSST
jgi:hypothetical protein